MRTIDLLTLPLAALWQQKMRTLLTTLGVVFGAFVLAASLSIGVGVRETIDQESHRSDISRRVDVQARWNAVETKAEGDEIKVEGAMADARRERIKKSLREMKQRANPSRVQTPLDRERINKLAALPHIERTVPLSYNYGFALLGARSEPVQVIAARPDDEAAPNRLVAGRYFHAPDERGAVISEFLAYRLGLVNDTDVNGLIGKPLRLEFRSIPTRQGFGLYLYNRRMMNREESAAIEKVTSRLPSALETLGLTSPEAAILRAAIAVGPPTEPKIQTEEIPVIGVARAATDEDRNGVWTMLNSEFDVLLPYATASDLYFRGEGHEAQGVNQVTLIVDKEDNVKDVVAEVAKLGLNGHAPFEVIERQRFIYTLIFGAMTCVAGIALLVSALGIANTMLMSVLERTREIGIMKAVGADGLHLQFIFLVEGALIGLIGAVAGLALAWAASIPGDAWVHSMVLRDIKVDLKSSIFVFPPWTVATVLIFTVLVTTLAALYPARRASRVDPVAALRHE